MLACMVVWSLLWNPSGRKKRLTTSLSAILPAVFCSHVLFCYLISSHTYLTLALWEKNFHLSPTRSEAPIAPISGMKRAKDKTGRSICCLSLYTIPALDYYYYGPEGGRRTTGEKQHACEKLFKNSPPTSTFPTTFFLLFFTPRQMVIMPYMLLLLYI